MTVGRPPFPRRQHDRQSGAALIAWAMALVMVGLALFGTMRFWGPKDDLQRASHNGAGNQIGAAIDRYVGANGYLPCPDTTGTGIAATACNTTTTWGLVPWQTLGLAPQDSVDAWGHRLTYVLPINSNSTLPLAPYVCNAAAIANSGGGPAIWSGLKPLGGAVSNDLAYLIINHGPNGRGAFQQIGASLGSQLAGLSGSNEAYNCPKNAGGTCPSPFDGSTYYPGPYQAQSAGTAAWFDDLVTPHTALAYANLCVQPTITTNINVATGIVTATASLTAPSTGNVAWSTSIGEGTATGWTGFANGCAGYPAGTAINTPIVTRAGQTCTVRASFDSTATTATIAAGSLENVGWQHGIPATPVAKTFLASGLSAATANGTATAVPAMSDMGFETGAAGLITACAQCTVTTSNLTGVTSVSFADATYGTITISSNGGYLCYDAGTETLGVVHGSDCYLGSSDILAITLPTANFVVYAMVMDFKGATAPSVSITASVTELNAAGDTADLPTYSDITPNPTTYSGGTSGGFMVIPWQKVSETDGVTPKDLHFKSLVITPGASSQIGLSQFMASP